jgi:tetratricopeptide (TPR) repeat protein
MFSYLEITNNLCVKAISLELSLLLIFLHLQQLIIKKNEMRISRIFYVLVFAILISSCGIDKMASKYETVDYTVAPSPLETHGGEIALNLDGVFATNYFAKKATVTLTPVLVYPNGETAFKTITIQGEEATGGEATIFYSTGGDFKYQDAMEYNSAMINSTLELRAVAKLKDKEKVLGPKTIANGVLATATRVLDNEDIATASHGYEHETILEETATIYFLVNQSNIRTTEKSNDDIKRLKEFANNGYKTHSIEIRSFASPEGSVNINDNVSDNRLQSTLNYTKKLLRSLKVDGASNNELYTESSLGEDWTGFESLVQASGIRDKRRINKIVNSVEDLELREQQIRDLAEIYNALENNILPQLRKAIIIIRSFEPKKTDEEIANLLIASDWKELDVKEALYGVSIGVENNPSDKEVWINMYEQISINHNDWRGYNNIACLYLADGNLSKAMVYLEKAESLVGLNSDILTNKGIIYARKGELTTAQKLFDQANTTENNQAILDIRKGEYKKAGRFFKNRKSHNAALAQLMSGKNNINCNESTAACHYLNAISSARSGNTDAAIKSLTNAITANANYKAEAAIDLEFSSLRANEAFIALTK